MTKVAVVGGGIAGVYAAWRLATMPESPYQIELFEMDELLGGRIRSQRIPGLPFRAELGAMRFRANHQLLNATINHLELPIYPFEVPLTKLRVRGRTMSLGEIAKGACVECGAGGPYQLGPKERDKLPDILVRDAIWELLSELQFRNLTPSQVEVIQEAIRNREPHSSIWKFIREHGYYEETPLNKIGFWNMLQHYLSNEAYQYLHDGLSLESVLGNWSAAEAMPWFLDDFAGARMSTLPGGMTTLVTAMLRDGQASDGGFSAQSTFPGAASSRWMVHKKAEVLACVRRDGKWSLTIRGWKQSATDFDDIIIALPQAALRSLPIVTDETGPHDTGGDGTDLSSRKPWLAFIDQVKPHILYKLFLLFDEPWWVNQRVPGIDTGRIYTDLPLRQVYYFHSDWIRKCSKYAGLTDIVEGVPATKTDKWSMVMASYSDEHYVSFWEPMAQAPYKGAPSYETAHFNAPVNFTDEETSAFQEAVKSIGHRANVRIVSKVRHLLNEIHGDKLKVPEPILGLFMNWGESPFGAGWHTWNAGTTPWRHCLWPDPDNPAWPEGLYLCGEAYSEEQGWIEGALKTAEMVLRKMEESHNRSVSSELPKHLSRVIADFDTYVGIDRALCACDEKHGGENARG